MAPLTFEVALVFGLTLTVVATVYGTVEKSAFVAKRIMTANWVPFEKDQER